MKVIKEPEMHVTTLVGEGQDICLEGNMLLGFRDGLVSFDGLGRDIITHLHHRMM